MDMQAGWAGGGLMHACMAGQWRAFSWHAHSCAPTQVSDPGTRLVLNLCTVRITDTHIGSCLEPFYTTRTHTSGSLVIVQKGAQAVLTATEVEAPAFEQPYQLGSLLHVTSSSRAVVRGGKFSVGQQGAEVYTRGITAEQGSSVAMAGVKLQGCGVHCEGGSSLAASSCGWFEEALKPQPALSIVDSSAKLTMCFTLHNTQGLLVGALPSMLPDLPTLAGACSLHNQKDGFHACPALSCPHSCHGKPPTPRMAPPCAASQVEGSSGGSGKRASADLVRCSFTGTQESAPGSAALVKQSVVHVTGDAEAHFTHCTITASAKIHG